MKNRYIKVIILIVFAIILVIIADRNKTKTYIQRICLILFGKSI